MKINDSDIKKLHVYSMSFKKWAEKKVGRFFLNLLKNPEKEDICRFIGF